MYQVMIVDDEIWSLIGLRKILMEDAQRFELIYETTDSLDALEQITEKCPDVVFTDVRMPEMTGIELIRNVKERGIKTEFVVISGFAEFSYVQQALQEGAIDYQLKPFDRNTVKQVLDKLYTKLESKRNISDLELYSLLRDSKDNVADLLQYKFGKELYQKIQLVLLYYKNADFQRLTFDTGENSQCTFLKIGPRKCIGIVNSNEDKTDSITEKLNMMDTEVERAAVSRVGDSVNMFEQLLKETEHTVMDSFVYPERKIFRYKKPKNDISSHLEELITDLHNNRNFRQLSEIVSSLPGLFVDNQMGAEDAVYLWNRFAHISARFLGQDREILIEHADVYELTERFADIQEMCNYINLQYISDEIDQSGTVNDKFFEMLRYIDKYYAQPLYLKELCNQFYINMSYCCVLFQKNKNMTFSQYLTDVRINKACDLLKYHKVTVSEACERVGYKDYFYFNKVFKKKMGCTPSEYRKNELVEN